MIVEAQVVGGLAEILANTPLAVAFRRHRRGCRDTGHGAVFGGVLGVAYADVERQAFQAIVEVGQVIGDLAKHSLALVGEKIGGTETAVERGGSGAVVRRAALGKELHQ